MDIENTDLNRDLAQETVSTRIALAVLQNDIKHLQDDIKAVGKQVSDDITKIWSAVHELSLNVGRVNDMTNGNTKDITDLKDWKKEVTEWQKWFSRIVLTAIIGAVLSLIFIK